MDEASAIGSLFAAFGLATASGLNAPLPVLAGALLHRFDVVELAAPFDDLSSNLGLITLGSVFAVDFVGDKVPALDHALHAVGTVLAPASGALVFLGQVGVDTEIPSVIAIAAGAALGESVHLGRASLRPLSTATTGGIGNPILSGIEDTVSAILIAVAFLAPVVAFLLVLALLGLLVRLALQARGRSSRSSGNVS